MHINNALCHNISYHTSRYSHKQYCFLPHILLPYEVSHCMPFMNRECDAMLFAQTETFQHPRHISRKGTHGLQSFRIPAYLIGSIPVHHIPVLRRDNRHVAVCHVFVQLVKRRSSSAATASSDGSSRFPGKMFPIELINEKYTVKERCQSATCSGIMHGSAEYEAVIIIHDLHELTDNILSETLPFPDARPTSDTTCEGLIANPKHIGLYIFLIQCGCNL